MPMNFRHRGFSTLVAGAFASALMLPAASARADDYDWLGIAYLWAADISVDSRDASVSADFNDILDKLEMAFQTHVEVQATISAVSSTSPSWDSATTPPGLPPISMPTSTRR